MRHAYIAIIFIRGAMRKPKLFYAVKEAALGPGDLDS